MLILIAESKTMASCDAVIPPRLYHAHTPILESEAAAIMGNLTKLTAEELAASVKISMPMARKLVSMIYEFPDKSRGCSAIEAYTGVVFRAFDYPTLPSEAQKRTCDNVRIISSLYGWLRPDDIIKPYRFDFGTQLATPDRATFKSYWKRRVTDCILSQLKENQCDEILNLLPGDAAQCIDWKEIAGVAKVYKADFKELVDGKPTRTPNAGRLKALRGRLLRQILCENIDSVSQLLHTSGDCYMAEGNVDNNGYITFVSLHD